MTCQRLMVVAGERSGDFHASRIIASLKEISPEVEVFGVGGERTGRSGAEIIADVTGLAVVGLVEVVRKYPALRRLFRNLVRVARERRPEAALLVDYPGFNLRLARALKSMGIKVVYFVSPQVWAWGGSRVRKMRKLVDKMIVVFDFEVEIYKGAGIDVEFVGHPLTDVVFPRISREEFRRRMGISEEAKLVAILPGSRLQEVERHVPLMGKAADLIGEKVRGAQFLLVAASEALGEECRRLLRKHRVSSRMKVVRDGVYEAISACDAAMVSSGTATLEAGCLGVPLVVVYKVSPLTYLIAKRLVTISNIGLVNIVAGRTIAPEFVQERARPERIAECIVRLLTDRKIHEEVREQLSVVRKRLGRPGAAERAARIVLEVMGKWDKSKGGSW